MFISKSKHRKIVNAMVDEYKELKAELEKAKTEIESLERSFAALEARGKYKPFIAKDVEKLCKVYVLDKALERYVIQHCGKYTLSTSKDYIELPYRFKEFLNKQKLENWVDASVLVKYLNMKKYVK